MFGGRMTASVARLMAARDAAAKEIDNVRNALGMQAKVTKQQPGESTAAINQPASLVPVLTLPSCLSILLFLSVVVLSGESGILVDFIQRRTAEMEAERAQANHKDRLTKPDERAQRIAAMQAKKMKALLGELGEEGQGEGAEGVEGAGGSGELAASQQSQEEKNDWDAANTQEVTGSPSHSLTHSLTHLLPHLVTHILLT